MAVSSRSFSERHRAILEATEREMISNAIGEVRFASQPIYTLGGADTATTEEPKKDTIMSVIQDQRKPYSQRQLYYMLGKESKFKCPICKKEIETKGMMFYEEDNPHFCSNYLTPEEIKKAKDEG